LLFQQSGVREMRGFGFMSVRKSARPKFNAARATMKTRRWL